MTRTPSLHASMFEQAFKLTSASMLENLHDDDAKNLAYVCYVHNIIGTEPNLDPTLEPIEPPSTSAHDTHRY